MGVERQTVNKEPQRSHKLRGQRRYTDSTRRLHSMPTFELKPMGSTNDKRLAPGSVFARGGEVNCSNGVSDISFMRSRVA